jgi:MFS transporter, DHA1 family, staphyloferrin B biosynthesis exporter
MVVVPLLPFYLAGLGLKAADVALWTGLALMAPAVTQALTGPLWGWVGDRYGRKAMVVRAQFGIAVAVGLMAIADTPEEFLVFRLVQGAFGGVASANAAFASSQARSDQQGRALGGLFGATGAGSLVGPLLGSVLASVFGFSAVFLAVAGLMVMAGLLSILLLREPAAVQRGRREQPTLPVRAAPRLLAATSAGRNLILAGFLGQVAISAVLVVFALRVEEVTASTEEATVWVGVLQAVTWTAALIGAGWWGWRNDRRSPHRNFALAAGGCAVAIVLQGAAIEPAMLLPLRIAQGFCFAALAQSVLHVVAGLAPETAKGSCLGLANGLIESGAIIGPLLGSLVATLLPLPVAFAAIGPLLALAAILAAFSGRPTMVTLPTPQPVTPSIQCGYQGVPATVGTSGSAGWRLRRPTGTTSGVPAIGSASTCASSSNTLRSRGSVRTSFGVP